MDLGNKGKSSVNAGLIAGVVAVLTVLLALGGLLISQLEDTVLLPINASAESEQVDQLFRVLLGIGGAIFLLVEGALLYSIIRFRVKKGDTSDGPTIHGNVTLELVWTAIPAVIVLFLVVYSYQVWIDIRAPKEGEMVVNATGARFAWTFNYDLPVPDDMVAMFRENDLMSELEGNEEDGYTLNVTSNILHVYDERPVVMVMNSQDVIHAFWVPEMRIKQDLLPGRTTEIRFTPIALEREYDAEANAVYDEAADLAVTNYRENGELTTLVTFFGTDGEEVARLLETYTIGEFNRIVEAVRSVRNENPKVDPRSTSFTTAVKDRLTENLQNLPEEDMLAFASAFGTNGINYNQYRVVCTELCGSGHGAMYAYVRVYDSEQDYYETFVNPTIFARANPPDDPVLQGAQILASGTYPCSGCHLLQESGDGFTIDWGGLTGPALEGVGERAATNRSNSTGLAPEEYLFQSLYIPGAYLVPGFNNLMNNFQFGNPDGDLYMPVNDAKAIVAYLCSLSESSEYACDLENLDAYAASFIDDN
ncbi:MAG: hypothetical protein CUN56_13770 [Phototrophicales bacterium]|nr:MAG: hypothetical protein CUN56_13770 [Phototrophicales bacterium]RMG76911.1 MAG: hypothetical protein D6711_02825 [Chloroflexota bacterium]